MLPDDRAQTFAGAPFEDLIGVLLRQLRRPLATHGVKLTDTQAVQLARDWVAQQQPQPDLVAALRAITAESMALLNTMNLTFQQSLQTDMNALGGWETTAEFLERANEKANAELRITLASALTYLFGQDADVLPDLLFIAAGEYDEETVIVRRVLAHVSGIPLDTPDWLTQVRNKLSSV